MFDKESIGLIKGEWVKNGPTHQVALHTAAGRLIETNVYDFRSIAPGVWSIVTHSHGRFIHEIIPAFRFLFAAGAKAIPEPLGQDEFDAVAILEGGSRIDIASRCSCFTVDGRYLSGVGYVRGDQVKIVIPTPSLALVAAAAAGSTDDFVPLSLPSGPLGYELWPGLRHNGQ